MTANVPFGTEETTFYYAMVTDSSTVEDMVTHMGPSTLAVMLNWRDNWDRTYKASKVKGMIVDPRSHVLRRLQGIFGSDFLGKESGGTVAQEGAAGTQ